MTGEDTRLTHGLVHDVFGVLEAHGYRRPPDRREADRATGAAARVLVEPTRAFEGGGDRT